MNKNDSSFRNSVEYIQQKLDDILDDVPQEDIDKFKDLLLESDRVFVYGAGRSGLVAKAFAIRLVHLGIQTYVIGETITAPVQKGDMVLIISGSGKTIPAVMTAEIAHNLKAKVVALTGRKNSDISRFSDVTLLISARCDEPERKKYAPLGTLFEASAWVLLDGVVAGLLERMDESEESMQERHATLQ